MSIAIVYMAKEFNWNHITQGFVLSSFYIGYLTTQVLAGVLADTFGGRRVLGIGAATWTLFTLLTPFSARVNIYCLILCRICLGIGEGVTFPCIVSLIIKWFPPKERSRATSSIVVSIFIGMAIALPISNMLGSSQFGWESIFWVFAIVGFIWSIIWHFYGKSDPRDYSGISKEELDWILESKSSINSKDNLERYQSGSIEYVRKIPWKLIFSRREVWAILLGEFFNSWGFFILLNWLPIFYYEYFHVDINLFGYYTASSYFSYIIMGFVSGYICDYAIHQLKIHVLTATYLAKTSLQGLLIITIGFALYSFQISSTNVSPMDIAPKYAGLIAGLTYTCATVPAFFGVALTGWILEITGNDWSVIWTMCSLSYIFAVLFFGCFAGGEIIID
ncbi:major facilitator superfamily domain-containing protein [Gigaspora rosea]|uniref:Major facilitator superfamily domain-containing protein n=1 Tax=Gigaspora rosea TaxID=44941 RepID=A0A397VJA1_9GLOM|nr:major facilitator superfamily domain-containing protein [Gigaspora rosea]